jgi:hypothetical protein
MPFCSSLPPNPNSPGFHQPIPSSRIPSSRPNIFLVSAGTSHVLDNLLCLLDIQPPLLGNNLAKHVVNLPRHMRRITTDVKIGFLGQEIVDEFGILLHQVLDVGFLAGGFAGEGVEDR